MSEKPETTQAIRDRIKLYEGAHEKTHGTWGTLCHHDGDIATVLEDWALPVAVERDALRAEVERLRTIINQKETT
jgi:hypothetical protein